MKICKTLQEVLAPISSDKTIFVHAGAATPEYLLNGLREEAPRLRNVELLHLHTEGESFYARPEFRESFR